MGFGNRQKEYEPSLKTFILTAIGAWLLLIMISIVVLLLLDSESEFKWEFLIWWIVTSLI